MKSYLFTALTTLIMSSTAMFAQSQDGKIQPQISVSGEGKIKVAPDQVTITIGIENFGTNATEVKRQNDIDTEKVVQFLKKQNLPKSDVQTQRVSLQPNYDYQKKKYTYTANQTIEIILKDLSKYDQIMAGLTESGMNRVNNVSFQTSKLEELKSEARKLAMLNAKAKANDYVSPLGQKVGKALLISENGDVHYPQPVMYKAMMASADNAESSRETLTVGEIDVTANVQVSFILD